MSQVVGFDICDRISFNHMGSADLDQEETNTIDGFVKSHFVNDFEHFGEKALMMFSVKNVPPRRDLIPQSGRVLVPLGRD
jgi:hypothetical protein